MSKTYKLVFLGEFGVGKGSLHNRFALNTYTDPRKLLILVSFLTRSVTLNLDEDEDEEKKNEREKKKDGTKVTFELWETLGQEKFGWIAIPKAYFRNAVAAVVVYDITNRDSFIATRKWIDELRLQCDNPNVVIALAGNKLDLDSSSSSLSSSSSSSSSPSQRQVPTAEAATFAEEQGCIFLEVSSKTGTNVKELFQLIAQRVNEQKKQQESEKQNVVQLEGGQQAQLEGSCGC